MTPIRDLWLGIGFLALGIVLLFVAVTNQRIVFGVGLCLGLGAMFLLRARRTRN